MAGSSGNPCCGSSGNPCCGSSGNPGGISSGNRCGGSSGNPCCGSFGNPGGDSSGNPCCGSSGCPLGGWMRLRKNLGFCCILQNAPSGFIRKSLLRFIREPWWRFIRKSSLRFIRLPAGRLDETSKKLKVLLHLVKCLIWTLPEILAAVHPEPRQTFDPAAQWAAG